ncbi:signal transduction histidine kinase [Leptolyngbya sp. PCC 7375]|nr:signal transduction histidine kinase [Leptolyngbya sp. PCC 7375]
MISNGFECNPLQSETIDSDRFNVSFAGSHTALSYQTLMQKILFTTLQGGTFEELVHWLPTAIAENFKLKGCQIELVDENQRTATLVGNVGTGWSIPLNHSRNLDKVWEFYKPSKLGKSLLLSAQQLGIENGATTSLPWLGCPMLHQTTLLGSVWAIRRKGETFDETEIKELQQIVDCLAIALHQTQLTQTVNIQQTEIHQLRQAKDEFLQLISHELFVPLGNIQLSTQTLERIFKDVSWRKVPQRSTVLKVLSLLSQECRRQKQFVDNLITLMFPEHQKTSEPMLMNLSDWLPSLLRTFETRLEQEELTLKTNIPAEPLLVECDITQLERTITELVTNAIKYTPPKKTIKIAVQATDKAVEIAIANTGVQIPANHQPHIFERFYRVPELDQQHYGGSGLGLALVKQLVSNLGGNIGFKSTKQKTTFTVQLPK